MHRPFGHSFNRVCCTFSLLIAATCLSSPSWAQQETQPHEFTASTTFTHLDRSHRDNDLKVNVLSLNLLQRLSADRSHFMSVSGAKSKASSTDNNMLGAAYGQILNGDTPGRTYVFAVNAGKGWNNNATSTFTQDTEGSFSAGVIVGAGQTFMLTPKDAVTVGSNFGLNYSWVDGDDDAGEGSTLVALPYVQYNKLVTSNIGAYARLSATYSDESVTMSGKKALYTPMIGASYSYDTYNFNAQYSKEFASKHDGDIFTISISRNF